MSEKRNILIVGASGHLGSALICAAQDRGHQFVGTYARNCTNEMLVHMDTTDASSVDAAVEEAIRRLGSIDAVIYGSAIDKPDLISKADVNDWMALMDVNFYGAVRVARRLLPMFLRQERGVFQFISSGLATRSNIGTAGYAASKAALNAFSRGLSKEHAKNGIQSYTIMPGFFDGGVLDMADEARIKRIRNYIDSRRIAAAAEIANFCICTLENSSYLSGADLEINGGLA